jgi:hypothetical protein
MNAKSVPKKCANVTSHSLLNKKVIKIRIFLFCFLSYFEFKAWYVVVFIVYWKLIFFQFHLWLQWKNLIFLEDRLHWKPKNSVIMSLIHDWLKQPFLSIKRNVEVLFYFRILLTNWQTLEYFFTHKKLQKIIFKGSTITIFCQRLYRVYYLSLTKKTGKINLNWKKIFAISTLCRKKKILQII